MNLQNVARTLAAAVGLWLVAFGLWAFLAPTSFYAHIAAYPPYNEHLLHDVGAFQLGLGATLLAALISSDALVAALAGNAVGAAFHFAAHVADADLGGRTSDPLAVGLLAAAVVAAFLTAGKAVHQ
jgi:uncharacterized protein YjeT (DUF2065 family)